MPESRKEVPAEGNSIDQEGLEECLADLQQARAAFNQAFHAMFPPHIMVGLWDQLQAWVDSEARAIMPRKGRIDS